VTWQRHDGAPYRDVEIGVTQQQQAGHVILYASEPRLAAAASTGAAASRPVHRLTGVTQLGA